MILLSITTNTRIFIPPYDGFITYTIRNLKFASSDGLFTLYMAEQKEPSNVVKRPIPHGSGAIGSNVILS